MYAGMFACRVCIASGRRWSVVEQCCKAYDAILGSVLFLFVGLFGIFPFMAALQMRALYNQFAGGSRLVDPWGATTA
jgi:hypothetical protein